MLIICAYYLIGIRFADDVIYPEAFVIRVFQELFIL